MKSDRSASPLIPGFDFLKTLASQAGKGIEGLNQLNNLSQGLGAGINGLSNLGNLGNLSGLGGFKQWVAPTLDPDELEKRIEELRTVQFWLEQNARMLGATIQALEVQKMTLSTLRSMNVKMPDLQQVLGAMVPQASDGKGSGFGGSSGASTAAKASNATGFGSRDEASAAAPAAQPASASRPAGASGKAAKAGKAGKMGQAATAAGEAAAGLVDPMKWWGALTEQFQSLATQALAAAPGMAPGAGAGKGAGNTSGQSSGGTGTNRASARASSEPSAGGSEKMPRARKTSGTRGSAGRTKAGTKSRTNAR